MKAYRETNMVKNALPLRNRAASPFRLMAHRHAFVASLLDSHVHFLEELISGLGSPLHVVLPQVFVENVGRLQQVFEGYGLPGKILYAKKSNKADCFVRACAMQDIGVDVASSGELAKALAAGVVGKQIGVSGPEKTDKLLHEALHHHCLIAIDSLQELQRLVSLASRSSLSARVLLRSRLAIQKISRFGLDHQEREIALSLCQAQSGFIRLEGFSFHLCGYSVEERAQSANEMIDLCLKAQERGVTTCRHVDIGGGLAVQYVEPQQWNEFLRQDVPEHYHAGKSFGGFYPYGTVRHGTQLLYDLLAHPVENGVSLAHKMRKHGIGIIVEPGRALLNQAGISIFEVLGVKNRHATDGYAIVTVQGSSFSLSEQWFNSEYLPDPVLLGQNEDGDHSFLACVGGSTCLESDMVTWRKVGFPRIIKPGDRIVYLNTAGYQMDSNESSFHEAELPRKVVVELHDGVPALCWRLDGI